MRREYGFAWTNLPVEDIQAEEAVVGLLFLLRWPDAHRLADSLDDAWFADHVMQWLLRWVRSNGRYDVIWLSEESYQRLRQDWRTCGLSRGKRGLASIIAKCVMAANPSELEYWTRRLKDRWTARERILDAEKRLHAACSESDLWWNRMRIEQ